MNVLFHLNIGLFPHIAALLISQVFLIFLRDFFKSIKTITILFDVAFIFAEAAFICVFIGWIFWEKGVLDFIYLKPLFIFDFKDLYLNCFAFLLLIYWFKNKTKIQSCKKSLTGHLKERMLIFRKKTDN
ncbi:MAG: hypothetical protein LBT25_03005 [Candidatus Symbiothrix sp.]|jgi:hypothetical protein|nr:hypothetical protein [Candidatus Symbiothrix sp.]